MKTAIEFHSKADEHGRRRFTLYWIDSEGYKRGQCFNADPKNHPAALFTAELRKEWEAAKSRGFQQP